MWLEIIDYTYENSKLRTVWPAPYRSPPRRGIARSSGAYSVPVNPVITVNLRETKTGRVYSLNAYSIIRDLLRPHKLQMSRNRAMQILNYYRRIGPFEAPYWDTWPAPKDDVRDILQLR